MLNRLKFLFIGLALLSSTVSAAESAVNLIAAKLNEINSQQLQVELQLSAPLGASPKSFSLANPARVVVDLVNVNNKLTKKHDHIGKNGIENIHVINAGNRTRVVIDLAQAISYQIQQQGNSIFINFNLTEKSALPSNGANQITHVNFQAKAGNIAEISIDLAKSGNMVELHKQGNTLLALFNQTTVPKNLQNILDVTGYKTLVNQLKLSQLGAQAQLAVTTHADYTYSAYQVNKRYVIDIQPQSQVSSASTRLTEAKTYQGKRISLNFQDIRVRAVLQLLAEFTGINIVASDAVQGSMTLQLNNIPWDQALDIILQTRGLDKRQVGNVILIAPSEEFTNREKKDLQAQQDVNSLETLRSELIQVSYAKAQDLATLLKDRGNTLLSDRGNVSVDNRTNTLWIQDVSSKISEIRQLVKRLDIPVQQVLIEARIVNMDKGFERSLGVRFGVSSPKHVSGTLQGADSFARGVTPTGDSLAQRLNVDLRAPKIKGIESASIGLALAKLGKNVLLDLELSALEGEGAAEIISTPRVITANQTSAKIEQGEDIPYQEATSSGATSTSFKKAVLSLNVTPQITPDGRIMLNLKVNQDAPTIKEYNGVPAIRTRSVETQVLVNNGQTVVLGGIYEQSKNNQVYRVPFLGKLPVIGALFRQNTIEDSRRELLIFVTPKIIKQSEPNV